MPAPARQDEPAAAATDGARAQATTATGTRHRR